MTKSPRLTNQPDPTTKQPSNLSGPMILFVTALDTTWRAFVPTIGGTFIGIGLDNLFDIAPLATIACVILGFATSVFLIAKQLRDVRRQR
jgi:hypothetical protein